MIEYGGSTGTRHCRRLAQEQAEVTTSNNIHLHPKEHVLEFGGQCAEQFPTKLNNHQHNMDITSYFNQRGQYSVYNKVYCKGTCVSDKEGSVESSRGQMIVLYRESAKLSR